MLLRREAVGRKEEWNQFVLTQKLISLPDLAQVMACSSMHSERVGSHWMASRLLIAFTSKCACRSGTGLPISVCCGMFCHYGTFCHYVVTERAEGSTRCTFRHPFASKTIICLSLPLMWVCVCVCARFCARSHVCARTHTCVCVMCICPWQLARNRECYGVLRFIIHASVSAKLKFSIGFSRLRGYCCP